MSDVNASLSTTLSNISASLSTSVSTTTMQSAVASLSTSAPTPTIATDADVAGIAPIAPTNKADASALNAEAIATAGGATDPADDPTLHITQPTVNNSPVPTNAPALPNPDDHPAKQNVDSLAGWVIHLPEHLKLAFMAAIGAVHREIDKLLGDDKPTADADGQSPTKSPPTA